MAASRMSRIPSHRLTFLLTIVCVVAATLADKVDTDFPEDVELITSSKDGSEYVAFAGADSESVKKPSDLKKEALNDKFHKFHAKTEADWNSKKDAKKSEVFIKDPKDFRLLRLISEGLLNPQDTLPIVSNDAITSSQINNSSEDISVNVQPEGMSGVVSEDINADSDEKIIIEKKKNAAREKLIKSDNDSKESEENIKINLDANAGVQNPSFTKQKGSITVPAQKQISVSKGKENYKKSSDSSNYEILSLKPTKEKPVSDEGVFDFVDSPLSDKHLVPAGTAQTSRINVKKGPNGLDYEYEYIYYYYEDEGETSTQSADKSPKGNEIPVSTGLPVQKNTTPVPRISSTTPKYSKPFSDEALGTRIKSTDVLNEDISSSQRDKFRYSVDNSGELSKPVPSVPSKSSLANEVYYQSQYNSARFPGRQVSTATASEQPQLVVSEQPIPTSTKQISRGRSHYNTVSVSTEDPSAYVTQSVSTSSKETPSRTKSSGIRQPGLELVDSNSFRTHSTNIPTDYDKTYSTSQAIENQPRSKSLKQSSIDFSGITQNQPASISTTGDLFKKEQTVEYSVDSERITPTTPLKNASPTSSQVTETVVDNTAPFSTLSDNSLTTVYGAGLTDKAAHDLYAIYQQTQNEESKNTVVVQDDRTTIVDESENTYYPTNLPTTTVYSTTTTTTTTTTTPAPTTTTTTSAPIVSTPLAGRGRFKGSGVSRSRLGHSSTTEAPIVSSESSNSENTEKSRVRFQPSNRREPGHRVSAYGKKGSTSTTSPDHDSSATGGKDQESPKPSFVAPTRNRYRGGSVRSESGSTTESQTVSTSTASKANFADRFSRRRPGLKTTTTAPSVDEESQKQETSSSESSIPEQQSTTFRSIRNKLNPNSQARPLRPGPKLNLSSRGKTASTSTTTANTPIDADTSGSADVPVEQKQAEENSDQEISIGETLPSTQSTTTASTPPPDALTKLKNRPKLRIHDKAGHTKPPSQQSNGTTLSQNRRQLVNNLLPRKKQLATESPKEEKAEAVPKPLTDEAVEESSPKSESEVSENLPVSEVSSTTESKLSSLIASRRRNLSARKPGTLANKQTANEES